MGGVIRRTSNLLKEESNIASVSFSGTATVQLVLVNNELNLQATGGSGTKTATFIWSNSIGPKFTGNAKLYVRLRRLSTPTASISSWINGVIDATINSFNISPSVAGEYELFEILYGSPVAPGDRITHIINFSGIASQNVEISNLYLVYE